MTDVGDHLPLGGEYLTDPAVDMLLQEAFRAPLRRETHS